MSHQSALAAHGLPLIGVSMDKAHLTYRSKGCYRRRRDHILHAAGLFGGMPATDLMPAAPALLQVGLLYGTRPFVAAGDAALARQAVTVPEILGLLKLLKNARSYPRLTAAVGLLDGRSESPGESLLRIALVRMGYRLRPQEEIVVRGKVYRVDFRVEGTNVLIEFDGMSKYGSVSDIRAEKYREEDLRAAGWVVVRFMWQDLDNPAEIRRRLEWALSVAA